MKKLGLAVALIGLGLASPALAQSSTSSATKPTNPSPSASVSPGASGSSSMTQDETAAQKLKQDLQSAGFQDVNVVARSFVVQAKTKDGNPVVMTIGPHGMSVFEAMNASSKSDQTGTVNKSAPAQK